MWKLMLQTISVTVLCILILTSVAESTNLQVTDIEGNSILLSDCIVDYTLHGPFTVFVEKENGLRTLQGEARVNITWDRFVSASFEPHGSANLTLPNGATTTVTLANNGDGEIQGYDKLGYVSIAIRQTKSITIASSARPVEHGYEPYALVIQDINGGILEVEGDIYSDCSAFGLTIPDGYLTRKLCWSLIESVSFNQKESIIKVIFKDQQNKSFKVTMENMKYLKLKGRTQLGNAELDYSKISVITVKVPKANQNQADIPISKNGINKSGI